MSEDQTTEVDEAPEADAPNLADLSFEDLSAIEDELIAEFESRSQTAEFSEDSMQELRDVVEALETVREEAANRAEFAAMQELVNATSVQDFATEEEAPAEEAPAVEAVEDAESVEDETPPSTRRGGPRRRGVHSGR
jgi:hypothetical protein